MHFHYVYVYYFVAWALLVREQCHGILDYNNLCVRHSLFLLLSNASAWHVYVLYMWHTDAAQSQCPWFLNRLCMCDSAVTYYCVTPLEPLML